MGQNLQWPAKVIGIDIQTEEKLLFIISNPVKLYIKYDKETVS
jgi:hypothetical protein